MSVSPIRPVQGNSLLSAIKHSYDDSCQGHSGDDLSRALMSARPAVSGIETEHVREFTRQLPLICESKARHSRAWRRNYPLS